MAQLSIIKDICKKKKLTLRALAEKINMSEMGLQRIMKTNSTKVETLEKISEVLEVPVSLFFGEEELMEKLKIGEIMWETLGNVTDSHNDLVEEHSNLIDESEKQAEQIEKLEEAIVDKDKIIELLESKLSNLEWRMASYIMKNIPQKIEIKNTGILEIKYSLGNKNEPTKIAYTNKGFEEAHIIVEGKTIFEAADKIEDWLVENEFIK